MSEREWIVVRRDRSFGVFPGALVQKWIEYGDSVVVVRRCADIVYADGFADALNYATQYRSVLPEWEG